MRISFVLSNDRHHWEMMLPVARGLRARFSAECQFLSLARLRGLRSVGEAAAREGFACHELFPFSTRPFRRSSGGGSSSQSEAGRIRRLVWSLILRPRFSRYLENCSLLVLPNDCAFPYGSMVSEARDRGLKTLLMQEGIRFSLPSEEASQRRYGSGGCTAIAVWGESSVNRLQRNGAAAASLQITGSPRHEGFSTRDWSAAQVAGRERLGVKNPVLLVTNPVDAQGLCSKEDKIRVVDGFIRQVVPALERRGRELIIRLHAGEVGDYPSGLGLDSTRAPVLWNPNSSFVELLSAADTVIVMSSTAGLEALLAGRRLGVLEIPGFGYAYDYVERGVGAPLPYDGDSMTLLDELLDGRQSDEGVTRSFLAREFSDVDSATDRVIDLIESLVRRQS